MYELLKYTLTFLFMPFKKSFEKFPYTDNTDNVILHNNRFEVFCYTEIVLPHNGTLLHGNPLFF